VVCICTGNALKDPDTIISSSEPVIKCSNNLAEIRKLL
jgi:threonine synthase